MQSRTVAVGCRAAGRCIAPPCVCCQAWMKDTRYPPLTWEQCIIQRGCGGASCVRCRRRRRFRHQVTQMRDDRLQGSAFLPSAAKLIDKGTQTGEETGRAAELQSEHIVAFCSSFLELWWLISIPKLSLVCWLELLAATPELITANELAKAKSRWI